MDHDYHTHQYLREIGSSKWHDNMKPTSRFHKNVQQLQNKKTESAEDAGKSTHHTMMS
jgi:hypothetical protein